MFKPSQNIPIGIFDSGVGGLSVWKEVIKILPGHQFLYFSDNAYSPYGPRPEQEIIERSRVISEFLIQKGAKIIVIACNTATAAAINSLRKEFPIPFVGMEPAVKPAAALTKTGVIGVLATKGTLGGSLYNNTLHTFASNVDVVEIVGKGLVPLVESGNLEGEAVQQLLKKYIGYMIKKKCRLHCSWMHSLSFFEKINRENSRRKCHNYRSCSCRGKTTLQNCERE